MKCTVALELVGSFASIECRLHRICDAFEKTLHVLKRNDCSIIGAAPLLCPQSSHLLTSAVVFDKAKRHTKSTAKINMSKSSN